MSRSSRHGRPAAPRAVPLTLAAVLTAAAVVAPVVVPVVAPVVAPAAADETPQPELAPTVDLVAPTPDLVTPVLDLRLATSDLKGAARIEEQEDEIKVTLSSEVLFDKDSARLRGQAQARLQEVADRLKKAGPGPLRITGYTDDLGSAQHGLVLSRRRAQAVSRVLRPLLPRGDHPFTVTGRGEADPAVPNTDEASRKLNRRVEIGYHPR